jgi:hypothetical protein
MRQYCSFNFFLFVSCIQGLQLICIRVTMTYIFLLVDTYTYSRAKFNEYTGGISYIGIYIIIIIATRKKHLKLVFKYSYVRTTIAIVYRQ